jgi:hypothetical protein
MGRRRFRDFCGVAVRGSVYDSPIAERVAQVRDGFVESWYGRGLLWSGATAKGVHLGTP